MKACISALIAISLLVSNISAAKEITPEFNWRREQFTTCVDTGIERLRASRDSTESLVAAILTDCESELDSYLQIAVKLREFELKRRLRGRELSTFNSVGEARLRELTNARLVKARSQ